MLIPHSSFLIFLGTSGKIKSSCGRDDGGVCLCKKNFLTLILINFCDKPCCGGDFSLKKLNSNIRDLTCTQKAFAEAVELTPARINQLLTEGNILVLDESDPNGAIFLFDSLKNFFLSRNVSGIGVDYWRERGFNEQAKRKLNELKLSELEGGLYRADDVDAALAEILVALRNNLLGLPAKFATQLENKNRDEIYKILTDEIEDKLVEISNLNFDKS